MTCDTKLHAVRRRAFVERDDEAAGGKERRQDVAHDVDVGDLLALTLLPDHRVLEHVERLPVELAVQFHRLAGVQHVHLALCPHPQKRSAAHHCRQTSYTTKSYLLLSVELL